MEADPPNLTQTLGAPLHCSGGTSTLAILASMSRFYLMQEQSIPAPALSPLSKIVMLSGSRPLVSSAKA